MAFEVEAWTALHRWPGLLLGWLFLLALAEPRLSRGIPGASTWITSPRLRRALALLALAWLAASWLTDRTTHLLIPAGLTVALGLVFRALLRTGLRADRQAGPELKRLILLLGITLWLVHPYATPRLVGAGDAEHYARQLADFITQARHHDFPVFVGQSLSAFSGSVHPLRVAPYFQYTGGLLDVLTSRSLTAVTLQNLLICTSLLAAVLGAYLALTRVAASDRRGECTWLALLYGTSPGVLALIYSGDMLASWMTLPWLPWLFLGWVLAWRNPASGTGLLLQAVSLAFLWLAHAPIALWAALLTLVSEGLRWFATGCKWRLLTWQIGAAMLCLLLCHYVFVSVAMLEVPSNPYLGFDLARGAVFESVRDSWHGLFRLVSGGNLAHDLHLSPGLLLIAALGTLTAVRVRGAAPIMVLTVATLLLLLLPWPAVTGRFWAAMPVPLMTVLEKWPVQRFYPLLSALLPFLGVLALAHPWLARPALRRALLLLLTLSTLWSAWEARKFIAHGYDVTRSVAATTRFLLPENNTLSRYSYEMWGYLPEFFSYGYMDPETQNRLIDPVTAEVRNSNGRTLQAAAARAAAHRFVRTPEGAQLERTITVPAGGACFVSFDFGGIRPVGTLLVEGRRLDRRYQLPASGGVHAFGALPGQNRGFLLRNFGAEPEEASIRFVSSLPGGLAPTAARIAPYDGQQLPFRLRSLVPFEIDAITDTGGWVETPKLLIPGYQVTVNGQPAESRRSPNGLLMTHVPAGTARIRLDYRAPWPLAAAFTLNATALVVGALCLLAGYLTRPPSLRPAPALGALAGRLLFQTGCGAVALAVIASLVALPALAFRGEPTLPPGEALGYHLRLKFPVGRHEIYETLLSWRDPAAATSSIVVFYENDRFIRIGCRKNGILKILTDSLPVSYFVPNELDVSREPGFTHEGLPASLIRVRFNRHVILETGYAHQTDVVADLVVGHEITPGIPGANPFRGQLLRARGNLRRQTNSTALSDSIAMQQ